MADIAPVPPVTSQTPTPVPLAVTPVEAAITSVPDKILQLTRQIQVTGLIAQAPDSGEFVLNTVLGSLKILLPILTDVQQKKLESQLINLFQAQRPLTIVIQPGYPPTQSFLLLPPSPNVPNALPPVVDPNIPVSPAMPPRPAVVPGLILSAVVLPPPISVPPSGTVPPAPQPLLFHPSAPSAPAAPPATGAVFTPPVPSQAGEEIPILPALPLLDEIALKAKTYADRLIPKLQEKILSVLTPQADGDGGELVQRPHPASPSRVFVPTEFAAQPLTPEPSETSFIDLALQSRFAAAVKSIFVETPPSTALQSSFQPHAPLQLLFQPGVELSLRVNAVEVPPVQLPLPSLPNQIIATVTGSGPGGQILLKAGDTTLYVRDSVNVPVGTSLLITIEPKETPALQPLPPLLDGDDVTVFQQALTALAQIDPALARAVTDNRVPQPNKALSGALLFFLSAVRQGDVGGWLGGDALEALSRTGKFQLIAKLARELTQSAQVVRDAGGGSWRSYPVPLYADQQFQILNFYVHGNGGQRSTPDQAPGKTGVGSVRFLIDMRLSKLGPMQLDGLARPKQLDMIVRSEQPLPAGLDYELRTTYANVISALGYAGMLNFQTGRQHWLSIYKETPATGSVVT
ncbi:MAG: hypothetical protein SFW62_08875 [Alphaproteobacteria bacterium]|nr:hypothetical protein [Alphaproteobacteria bacterium]